ncbi:covalently-linked cell wall protein [Diplodia corticola]|uniref:Covalently-linked cell wall protein n=1 Tax=Diplodia corticola TaxID=236234 RepID=A0A1J9RYB1_9PEZI|nr:covalently-linked cell wall protein [Diplodia corticola]OJD37651.1 covalently-linked cell wall protein [Diplodia corticola]
MRSYAAAAAVGALAARGVHASPFPQAVTAAISPSAAIPSGCSANYSGSFGIAVVVLSSSTSSVATPSSAATSNTTADVGVQEAAVVTPSISSSSSSAAGVYVVSQIGDGQIQAPTTAAAATPVYTTPVPTPDYTSVVPISEISDGQPQAPAGTPTTTPLTPATPTPAVTSPSSPSYSSTEAATTVIPISEISDGQPQAPAATSTSPATTTTTTSSSSSSSSTSTTLATSVAAVSQISDGQIQSPTSAQKSKNKRSLTACATSSTLTLTLSGDAGGVLLDAHNRTGYIASNYQFQFDGPPQSGALYTAGFSVCEGGGESGGDVLALGGSKTWYRCLSGGFYNLYDRWWAEQCEEVGLEVVELVDC